MDRFKAFLKRKNILFTARRYGIDALGAMAQGLFCSLLIGTIIKTLGQQLHIQFLIDIGTYAMAVSGPAMAIAIGHALQAPAMVLFSLAAVGWAANAEGGAGGPLAVLIIAIVAAEFGKAVSKETKIDILVTPAVTILVGVALAKLTDTGDNLGKTTKGDTHSNDNDGKGQEACVMQVEKYSSHTKAKKAERAGIGHFCSSRH